MIRAVRAPATANSPPICPQIQSLVSPVLPTMSAKRHLTAMAALTALTSVAHAVTSFSDSQMISYLNAGGGSLANAYAPIWFFGQSQNQPPCIPTWAFSGTPSTPDVYDSAHKTPAAPQCQYPNVGCNCRNPGVAIGNPAPPFPIYYSYQQCNATEVRVAYNLFYQKDGAQFGDIATGHD